MSLFNFRFRAVVKRELRMQILTKRFLIMTLMFPLIMIVSGGIYTFVLTFDSQDHSTIHIATDSPGMQAIISSQIEDSELNDPELYSLDYVQVPGNQDIEAYIEENRALLLRGQITGVVYIPDSARDDKGISYYSTNPNNQILLSRVNTVVNRAVVGEYFRARNMDNSAVEYARSNVSVENIRVGEQGNAGEGANIANLIVAGIFTFFMYISLLSMGPVVMAAVNEEKTNRVVEILLSAVKSDELMAGKIIGTAVAGLLQMIIWLSPLIVFAIMSLPGLAMTGALEFQVSGWSLLYFLINYFFGVLIFMSIFAAFGAMFDNPQDAQSSLMPVMMLIIIPFILAVSMVRDPANFMAEVFSMIPFTNLMVMPGRMTLIDVPTWQILVAILVNLATFYYCIKGSAKIYRTTILMTGKKPTMKEVVKWVRHA